MTALSDRPAGETSEARIAKALAHPLRARILQRLGERVASPGDLADELGAPLGVVSYHVRMLRDYECVELVRTEPRRGALQHFYRAIARPALDEDQWAALPSKLREELAGATLVDLVDEVAASGEAGKVGEAFTGMATLELDDRARQKLDRLLGRTFEAALQIATEASARIATGAVPVSTKLALLHFERGTAR